MGPDDDLPRGKPGDGTWFECFDLEYSAGDASLGGHVTVLRWPAIGRAWYWGAVVAEGTGTVTVLETEIRLERSLELRASGLWADHVCEAPFEHWSYGLEAFALRLDHPGDALGDFRGERVPLGLDLEWEATAGTEPSAGGYGQAGRVHGLVLVGETQVELDGCGRRGYVAGTAVPPIRPGGCMCGPTGWADDAPAEVTGASVGWLPPPAGLVVHRLLGRSATGAVGWANLLTPSSAPA